MKKAKKRADVALEFKWKISDMIKSDELWQQMYDEILASLGKFDKYRGKLAESSDVLLSCLMESDRVEKAVGRVYVYSFLRFYEDTGNQCYKGMSDKSATMASKVSAATSFIGPEIISIPKDVLESFMQSGNGIELYAHKIEDLLRQKQYILPEAQEEILAKSSEISRGANDIFSVFHESDMKFGMVTDENNEEAELTLSNFTSFMESQNRKVRETAFNTLYDQITKFKNTYAGLYSASVISDNFYADVRKYKSSLEMALMDDNIPCEVYKNLISTVGEYLPELHRYIKLRKKKLELDELHMYDLYTPMVKNADTHMPYEKAKDIFIESMKPMGEEYVETIKKSFEEGWIDVYENEGKRSGAFQWGVYGCHPFVCLNYDNKINDMFTLAHEMGHAMHSHYTWSTQPFAYSDYTIFLAEVASTVNEALLMDYLLKTSTDDKMKEYLINYFLEQFRGTIFRQVMFAEFEMMTHEMAASGEPLTADSLCGIYYDLNKKYYGEDIVIDAKIAVEWARIPHFYNAFYVYKYATGYSAAIAFSRKILNGTEDDLGKYIEFLKAGSSNYSAEILKKAGVDMTTSAPVKDALEKFKELLDLMENM